MIHEFHLPDIGEGLTEAEIVAWLVGVGDTVTVDQPIVEVETAKTTVEIPAPFDGTITSLVGSEGDVVAVGDVLFVITDARGESTLPDVTTPATRPVDRDEPAGRGTTRSAPEGTRRAMPAVRKLAGELGVDLASVVGTGPGGSITADDVRASSAGHDAEDATRGESTPLSPTRRAIAAHMTESWTTIPHVTVQAEIRAEALLADRGIRAHLLGGRETVLKQPRQHLAGAPGIAGCLIGVFDLAEDLRFAQHQRIEPAGDRQQM